MTSSAHSDIPLYNRFEALADWREDEEDENTAHTQETDREIHLKKNPRRSSTQNAQIGKSLREPNTSKFEISTSSGETIAQVHRGMESTESSIPVPTEEKTSEEPTVRNPEEKKSSREDIVPDPKENGTQEISLRKPAEEKSSREFTIRQAEEKSSEEEPIREAEEEGAPRKRRTRSPRREHRRTSRENTTPKRKSLRRPKTTVPLKDKPSKQRKKRKPTAEKYPSKSCPVSITGMEHVIPPFASATVTVEIQSNGMRPKRSLRFAPGTPKDGLEIRPRKINPITWPFMEVTVENFSEKPQYLRVGLLVGNVVEDNTQSQVLAIDNVNEGELQEFQSEEGNRILRWRPPTSLREQLDPVDYLDCPALTFPLVPLRPRNAHCTTLSPIDWEPSALPTERTEELQDLLKQNRDIFATDNDPLGVCNILEFRIETDNSQPVRQRPYRVAPSQEKIIKEGIDELLKRGLIRESTSDYGAPVVMVPKKDGKLRFCVSYKKLNEQLKNPSWPMPHMFETLTRLGQSRFFSTLDLKSGYHQIRVAQGDQHKTAFTTPWACFEFLVMPFGIKTAPSHFMRVMQRVLHGLPNVVAYLDDVLVHSATFDEHLQHLQQVFDRLRSVNLRLHPGKCVFAQQRCQFLGHIISAEGVAPNPEKIRAILHFPRPTNVKKVRQFLGVTSFFRRHIPEYAKKAQALHQLLRKDNPFIWTAKTSASFEALKHSLIQAPVLKNPDFEREFIVTSDASAFALGAVLTQKFPTQDGTTEEFPIAFASRTLKPNELNYTVSEKELLAVIYAVQQFDFYVQGKHFTIRCDHRPLQYILNSKTSKSARLERWSILLQGYNFTTEYQEGRSIAHADALSRNPPSHMAESAETSENNVYGIIDELDNVITLVPNSEDIPEYIPLLDIVVLREEQGKDECCRPYLTYLKSGRTEALDDATPLNAEKYHLSPNLVLLKEIQTSEGPLTRTHYAVVIPNRLKQEILMAYHNTPWGGHQGSDKTFRKMAPRVFWPGMRQDIQAFCQSCPSCQKIKITSTKRPNPMSIPRLPSKPFEIVAIDIVGPLPSTENGKRYLLTVLDHLTRFCEAIPLRTQTAKEVGRTFVDQIVCRYGSPKCLISDRGGNFTSHLFRQICAELKIRRVLTTAYHPQSNGALERTHLTIKNTLTAFVHQNQHQWEEYIPKVMFSYNSSPHSATGFSPAYLLFGRELELPLDSLASQDNFQEGKSPSTWPESFQKMRNIFQWVNQRLAYQAEKRKQYYDASRKTKPHGFQAGDLVLIRRQTPFPAGETPKLGFRFSGPFRVARIHPPSTLVIEDPQAPEAKRTVHVDKAIPFKTPTIFPDSRVPDPKVKKFAPVSEEIPGSRLYDSSGVMDLSDFSPTAFPDGIPVIPLEPEMIITRPSTPVTGAPFVTPMPTGIPSTRSEIFGGAADGGIPPPLEPAAGPTPFSPRHKGWKKVLQPLVAFDWAKQRFKPTTKSQTQPTDGLTHGYATRARGPVPDYPLPARRRQSARLAPYEQGATTSQTPRTRTATEPSTSTGHRRDQGAKPKYPVSFIEEFYYPEDDDLYEEPETWWDASSDEFSL